MILRLKSFETAILIALLMVATSCGSVSDETGSTKQAAPTASSFFSAIHAGGIDNGRIYLEIRLPADSSGKELKEKAREEFLQKALKAEGKTLEDVTAELEPDGYGGEIIPDKYLDLSVVEAATPLKVDQPLKVRTVDGVIPARIAKYEVHYSQASGDYFLYAVAEPTNGTLTRPSSERVLASADMPDCSGSCKLSRAKPEETIAAKVRAIAVEKLGVAFPADVPQKRREETFVAYEGRFTRTDAKQYVAFFARHDRDALDVGKWVAYVVDSDLSLISVLGRDEYLNVIPEGIADVNGDGLDEVFSNDVGFEGSAYSVWYLANTAAPFSFGRVQWPYFGL